MPVDRRGFLKTLAAGSTFCLVGPSAEASAPESTFVNACAMLNDSTRCTGCRGCQTACRDYHGFKASGDDPKYDQVVDLEANHHTVIKLYRNGHEYAFVKRQCMHCNYPTCVSACPVGALVKDANGAVTYDKNKCIGCRYCMFACPFSVPRFDYHDPFPEIQKCSLCHERLERGRRPVCAEVCPAKAIVFGTRGQLLAEARSRIAAEPERYVPHVYGENEVGGTSVMYLSGVPFARLGFESFDDRPLPELCENVQHGIFKWFAPPIGLLLMLGLVRVVAARESVERVNKKEDMADE